MPSICSSILLILAGAASAEETLSIDQILARHKVTLVRLNRCSVTTMERWMITRADSATEQILSTRKCDIRMDDPRVNLSVYEVNYPLGIAVADAGTQGNANEFNYVCNDQVLEVFYPHAEFDVRPAKPSGVNGRLSKQHEDEFFVQHAMGNAAIVFGVTTYTSPIPIAKLIQLDKNSKVTQDQSGYRVEGESPDGTRHQIWFDPESSFVIRRLRFEQSRERLGDNRFQYNRTVMKVRYGFADKAVIDSVVFELGNVTVVPLQGTHVITGLETTKTISASDGTRVIERTMHTLTDWNLEPDFSDPASFQPTLPIPEGSRVMIRETPSLEYCYQDGRIQLAIDEPTLVKLKQVTLTQQSGQSRIRWLWGVVAGVLGLIWWRIRAQGA